MNPQGSSIVDTQYFARLTAQVNRADTCADLQAIADRILPSLAAQQAAMSAELAALSPALALLTLNPADLPGVITFIGKLVTFVLTPQLKPTITYAAQLTETIAAIAALTSAITTAAGRIQNCTVTI